MPVRAAPYERTPGVQPARRAADAVCHAGTGHADRCDWYCGFCCRGCRDIQRREGATMSCSACVGALMPRGHRGMRSHARSATQQVRATQPPRRAAVALTACVGAGGVRCFVCTGTGKVAAVVPSADEQRGAAASGPLRSSALTLSFRSDARDGPDTAQRGRLPRVQRHRCACAPRRLAELRSPPQPAGLILCKRCNGSGFDRTL